MADREMSFLEHLEDLRWHLLRSITAILIAALAAFLAKDFVFDVLLYNRTDHRDTSFLRAHFLYVSSFFTSLLVALPIVAAGMSKAEKFSSLCVRLGFNMSLLISTLLPS